MKMLYDTWLLFLRSIRLTLHNPVWAILGLFQPLCYMFLFAPLLQPISNVPGFPPGGALTVFIPGILVMMSMFSTVFNGFGLIFDLQAGVLERLCVTPVSRWALLLGLLLRDVLILLIQSSLLVLVALTLGLHINLAGLFLTLGLLIILAICLSSCSYALAILLRDANALSSSLNTLTLPALLLSGIVLPLTLAPSIIRMIARINPLSYTVDAARLLFRGVIVDGTVLEGFIIITILAGLAMLWAMQSFKHVTA